MRISSQNSQFVFSFPVDFIEDWLYDVFQDYIDKNNMPYDNALDYLNATIKEINYPGITYEFATQTVWKSKQIDWKSTKNVFDTFNRDLDVTFRSVDSHANYYMMEQIANEFYLNNDKHYLPYISLAILDKNGDLLYSVIFKNALFKSLSDNRMSYQSQDFQEKTFTATFRFVWLDIIWETKRHQLEKDRSIFQLPKYENCDQSDYSIGMGGIQNRTISKVKSKNANPDKTITEI